MSVLQRSTPVRIAIVAAGLAASLSSAALAADAKQHRFGELKPSAIVHLGKTADWVAVTDDAVWVGGTGPQAVFRIDPRTNRRIATVRLPGEPCAGLVVGFGSLWVPLCGRAPVLAQVDLKSNALVHVFHVGPVEAESSITASADSVWMTVGKAGSLARIDPVSGAVRQTIPVPVGSYNPVYADGRVWITDPAGGKVTVIDAARGERIASLPAGPGARWSASGAGAIWVLNTDGSLTRVDTATRSSQTVDLGLTRGGAYIGFGAGMLWTTTMKVPLSLIDPSGPALRCRWVGKGGDSLDVGHGAVWLTNYYAGTIERIPVAEILRYCQAS